MLALQPHPEVEHSCPRCGTLLSARGWYMPGMRILAELHCRTCDRAFFGDFPAGGAINYEMVLDPQTGEVFGGEGSPWFADWLTRGFRERGETMPPLQIETRARIRRPLLLNCLDVLYGHSLLKLLNAQHHLEWDRDFDLVVFVPACLRWLVPEGCAEIWTVDVPLARGWFWSDGLANAVRRRYAPCGQVFLSRALSHPAPEDFDIARFSGVAPFPVEEWVDRLTRPTLTFVVRDERTWGGKRDPQRQLDQVAEFAGTLRRDWPTMDLAVAGVAATGTAPDGLTDLRCAAPDEATERGWCARYAASHLAIGVHGSNMLLPSAHAGGTIDLVPQDRWSNVTQDVLFRPQEAREAAFRYRFVPLSVTPGELAAVTSAYLRSYREHARLCWGTGCRHPDVAVHASAGMPER